MVANKEKEKQEKISNLENELQKSQLQEFSASLKSLIDSAVKIYLKKPIDKENLDLVAKEILEKFGATKSIKTKISETLYALYINEKTKLIHVNYDSIEFTIQFPKISMDEIESNSKNDKKDIVQNSLKNQNKTNEEKEGGLGNPNLRISNQNSKEELNNEIHQPKEEEEIQFKSIPIYFKSPLQDIGKDEKEQIHTQEENENTINLH